VRVRVGVSDGLLWTEQSWTLQVKDNVPLTATIDPRRRCCRRTSRM
jgi:hypothetical protein